MDKAEKGKARGGSGGSRLEHPGETLQEALDLAVHHHTAGRLPVAEGMYHQILKSTPNQPVALHLLGLIAHQAGQNESAVEFITKALAQNPDYAEAHNNHGRVLRALGRLDDAVASYNMALAIQPDFFEAYNNLGIVLRALGKLDDAAASYQKAIALKPDYAVAHTNLGNALKDLGKPDEAVASYRKAITIMPGYAEAYCNLGSVLNDLGKAEAAAACHLKALGLEPDYAMAHFNLGNALQDLGKLDDAEASYLKALALKPDYAKAHNNLGTALQKSGKLDEAQAGYLKALALNPDYAEAATNLGTALQNLGKLDEAQARYRQALDINPDLAEAHRHLANVKNFSDYDNDIKAMESAYAMPGLGDEQRMHLAFGLGKAFEDLRQFEKAFGFFLTGNSIKRGTYDYPIDDVEKSFANLKNIFSKDLFAKHQPATSSDESPIFVLGMLRSGTTLVEQILASHPHVHGTGELDYLNRIVVSKFSNINDAKFNVRVNQATAAHFSDAGGKYISMIRERSATARFITNKLPINFRLIGMIRLMLPNAKIIHCRRDKRDTCLSIFKNYFASDRHYYAYDLGELGQYYNLYRDLMDHWHRVLPDFIYHIQYEDLVADQEGESRALLEHCGLEWDDACLEFHRADRPVHTASSVQVHRPIYKESVQSWKRYENWLSPLFETLR